MGGLGVRGTRPGRGKEEAVVEEVDVSETNEVSSGGMETRGVTSGTVGSGTGMAMVAWQQGVR